MALPRFTRRAAEAAQGTGEARDQSGSLRLWRTTSSAVVVSGERPMKAENGLTCRT